MEKKIFLDIDWLWLNKQMVHYFGLGFIQLKLNQTERVHFYSQELMKTVGDEDVHNHRYNFVSEILKGSFSQKIFDVSENHHNYTHYLRQESCQENLNNQNSPVPVNIELIFEQTLRQGEKYFMDHNTFHSVESLDAVTFLTRGEYKKTLADVATPKGQDTVCPFSIKLSQEEIFDHIREIIRN